jgi:hypothetical protein
MAGFLPFLSGLLGWIYTFCWSASFYPQPFLNWRRKTTAGSTVDFPFINVFGMSFSPTHADADADADADTEHRSIRRVIR